MYFELKTVEKIGLLHCRKINWQNEKVTKFLLCQFWQKKSLKKAIN